jgi:small conductance mechanosensitive channel
LTAFSRLANTIVAKSQVWLDNLIGSLPNFILAIFVFFVGIVIAKYFRKATYNVVNRIVENKAVTKIIEGSAYMVALFVTIFAVLSILDLEKTVTSLLAGAGVIGLALGFAFQEIASNFVSGIFIAFQKPFKIGDIIQIDSLLGTITNIELRTTTVETFQGLEVLVPNKRLFTETVTNLTFTPKRRVDVEIGVSYATPLKEVDQIVREAVKDIRHRMYDRPIEIFFKEFADSSINFEVRVWIHYPGRVNYFEARNDMIIAIKEAFDQNNITIPFPIRTLDFGIQGGQTLEQSLSNAKS